MTLHQLVEALDFERLAGTAGEERGRQVITDYLKTIGLNPYTEQFKLYGFESGSAQVSCEGQCWEATPYGLCSDLDISGEMVFLENADALLYNPGAYDNKIVLFYHSDRRLYDLYEYSKVKAFIGISAPQKGAYSYSHRQNRDRKEIFPIVMICYEYAEKLIRLSGKIVNLHIEQLSEEKTAHNIIVDVPGTDPDNNLCLLMGHYDTVARSHGAADNAGGTVCLLKAAEHFRIHPPRRDLRIIWFSGEELGLLGSFAYTEAHKEELCQRVKLVLNVDLAGDPIGRNVLFTLGTKELLGYASGILKEEGLIFSEQLNIYSSDCMPFCVFEIPSLNLARVGGKALFYCHTEDDLAKHTTEYGLNEIYKATVVLLTRVLNAVYFPVTKEIDDSLRDKIERYLYHSLLDKPELKWREKYRR